MPRYDPASSGRFSFLSEKKKSGFVASVSTREKIPKGRYKVIFKMKKEGKSSKALPGVPRIDIVSSDTRRLLVAKNLRRLTILPQFSILALLNT
jgi:hypothetical protein